MELKFRAWHSVHKRMYQNKDLSVLAKNIKDDSVWTHMLFTGLKDISGKEIYFDCDIFKFKYMETLRKSVDLIGVMAWNSNEMRAEIDIYLAEDGRYRSLSYQGNGAMYDFDVIGNVYESGEILK